LTSASLAEPPALSFACQLLPGGLPEAGPWPFAPPLANPCSSPTCPSPPSVASSAEFRSALALTLGLLSVFAGLLPAWLSGRILSLYLQTASSWALTESLGCSKAARLSSPCTSG